MPSPTARSLLVPLVVLGLFAAENASAAALTMSWYTIDAGGGSSSAGVFQLTGTIGQFDTGTILAGEMYTLKSGFWHGMAPLCTADFNNDGFVDSSDFFAFLAVFFEGVPAADFDHSASVDSSDFFAFLAVFFEGCP